MVGCSDYEDKTNYESKIKDIITGAEITNKEGATIDINNEEKTLTIKGFHRNDDIYNVRIKFTLAEFVYMTNPKELESEYNLRNESSVTLRYGALGTTPIIFKIINEFADSPDVDPTAKGWAKTDKFGKLPAGIDVYMSPDMLAGQKVKACIVVSDMSKERTLAIYGGEVNGLKTPDTFYEETQSPVIINGTYFYQNWNVGMLIKNGTVYRDNNAQEVARQGPDGENVTYYPTRGVFNFTKGGRYQVDWMYNVDGSIYAYGEPSPIVIGQDPKPKPTADYPAKSFDPNIQTAIGAGPILIKNGKVENTWQQEIWDNIGGIMPESAQPRTAVGITQSAKLIYFVCEGRQSTPGVAGLSTGDVAKILQELGCIDAINLDGGGSTCMLVNGQQTINTCNENGIQRAVATVLAIN